MKALVYDRGKVEFSRNWPDPVPQKEEVLISVRKAGICSTDLEIAKGYMNFHGVMGHEFVGVVSKGPRNLQGKRVVAEINCICGRCDMCQSGLSNHCRNRQVIGIDKHDGVFAEFVSVPARNVHVLPDAVTDEEAIFVEPLASAMQVVRQVPMDSRQKVIVVGDGRLGLLTVQVLRIGPKSPRVVLLGKHPDKIEFCEKRGIQTYLLQDFVIKPEWDVVVDCTGSPEGFATSCRLVRPRGKLVLKSTWVADKPVDLSPLVVDEITLIGSRCGPFPEAINALAADHVVVNGLITSAFPLSDGETALARAKQPNQIKVVLQIS